MREVWGIDGPVRLFAVIHGEGPGVVFLHGGLASHQAVLPLVVPLSDRHLVITPDMRGSGRSWSSESLTFDGLADDVLRLLDHLGVENAIVGGVSTGSGTALRFALRHPERTRGVLVVQPVYAGCDIGYTTSQASAFAAMDSVANRASVEGIEVLRPMYERLPDGIRQRAWQMASEFDPGSVAATSRFIVSGAQPFDSSRDLRAIRVPTLLVRGDDEQHPAEVSDLYAAALPNCTVLPAKGTDTVGAIRDFCAAVVAP